jgi:hypothetical protein
VLTTGKTGKDEVMAKKTEGISTIASGRLPNESYAELEKMAARLGETVGKIVTVALLEFLITHRDIDGNKFAMFKRKHAPK